MEYNHTTAMLQEAVDLLQPVPGMVVADCTLGGCGHALAICERIMPNGLLIGIDQDQDAIDNARVKLSSYEKNVRIFHGNFTRLPEFLSQLKLNRVDGILVDLGLSLNQIEKSGRGFSFRRSEPLDMRMDVRGELTAAQIVNGWKEKELERIFKEYGEERWARPIARRIIATRELNPISTSQELAQLVVDAIPKGVARSRHIHPATRVFMALRIAVNQELEMLELFLQTAVDLLNKKGRLCVLSFHSLEDRIVKRRFKALAATCTCPPRLPLCVCGKEPLVKLLTRKVKRPDEKEIESNPMARSTRLRAVEKC